MDYINLFRWINAICFGILICESWFVGDGLEKLNYKASAGICLGLFILNEIEVLKLKDK